MRFLILILILVNVVSCIRIKRDELPCVETRFLPYYNEFLRQAKDRGINLDLTNLTIKGSELPLAYEKGYTTQGMTYVYQGRYNKIYKEITIYLPSWRRYDTVWKEQLLFHELGHALLGRDHNDKFVKKNGHLVPESIMCAVNLPRDYLNLQESTQFRLDYLNELFKIRGAL